MLVSVVVAILSIVTGLSPMFLWESHGDIISQAIVRIVETGTFLPLIYFFTKLFGILKGLWERGQILFEQPPVKPKKP